MGPVEGEPAPTAVVTGATSGVGAEVALGLARRGFRVVVVGRDPSKCEAMRRRLATVGGPTPPPAVVADLARTHAVEAAARTVRASHPRVELLVNNAGAVFAHREETDEGHERTFALNVLAPFLLTRRLEPALVAAGGGARVVNVVSEAHRHAHVHLSDLESRARYRGFRAYGRSKLALLLLTYAFARRWPPERIAFFGVHPGFVASGFGRNNRGAFGFAVRLAMTFAIPVEQGAVPVLFAATADRLVGATGGYVVHETTARSSERSYDAAAGERLWSEVERAVDRAAPTGPAGATP